VRVCACSGGRIRLPERGVGWPVGGSSTGCGSSLILVVGRGSSTSGRWINPCSYFACVSGELKQLDDLDDADEFDFPAHSARRIPLHLPLMADHRLFVEGASAAKLQFRRGHSMKELHALSTELVTIDHNGAPPASFFCVQRIRSDGTRVGFFNLSPARDA
jgi:hypothetical protein